MIYLIYSIIVIQIIFFIYFLKHIKGINTRFKETSNLKEIIKEISNEPDNELLINDKYNLKTFLKPYLDQLKISGTPINWEELHNELLYPASRNEEIARSCMNNIIVLGLLGTAASIAIIFLIKLKTGNDSLTLILQNLPSAFISVSLGLILGIYCSICLSNRIIKADKETESFILELKFYLPPPTSNADLLKFTFADELKSILSKFPQELSKAITGVKKDFENLAEAISQPLSELPEKIENSINTATNQLSNQIVSLSQILTILSNNTNLFQESINSFSQKNIGFEETIKLFSKEIGGLFNQTNQTFSQINHLVKMTGTTVEKLDILTDKTAETLAELNGISRILIDENTKSISAIKTLMEESLIKSIKEELSSLFSLLKDENIHYINFLLNNLADYFENLYQKIDNKNEERHQHETFQLYEVRDSFSNFITAYNEYQNNLIQLTNSLERADELVITSSESFKLIMNEINELSKKMIYIYEKYHEDINTFSTLTKKINSALEIINEDRAKGFLEIINRVDRLVELSSSYKRNS